MNTDKSMMGFVQGFVVPTELTHYHGFIGVHRRSSAVPNAFLPGFRDRPGMTVIKP
jgi:hypothetical protein